MARRYRSRRYRPRSGRRLRMRRSTLKRIKKDIMKCNFPTKVKFMGLTEKKVMFLTKSFQIGLTAGTPGISFYLDPRQTENISSILKEQEIVYTKGKVETKFNATISNWDKICILGIYIKFQPRKNMWEASGNENINTVTCTYTMNNFPSGQRADLVNYDQQCKSSKQVFTFNSNEAFTIYVPAPTTMCSESPCVYKSKTWWALANIDPSTVDTEVPIEGEEEESEGSEEGTAPGGGSQGACRRVQRKGEEEEDDMEEEFIDAEAPPSLYYCTPVTDYLKPYIHAGRIHLESAGASYNVTINYKVALKG